MSGGSTLPRVAALCALGASLAVLALVSMPGGHRAGRVALVGDDDLFDLIPPVTYTPRGVISHSALPPEEWPQNYDGSTFVQFDPAAPDDGSALDGIIDYPARNGDYYASKMAPPVSFDVPKEEQPWAEPRQSYNDLVWCPYSLCDYTSESSSSFRMGEYDAPVPVMG
mmetsp:Transcript_66624/g.158930  ORF Transcript_66624/g.158930 Transcript_66624/m.158930 type:complete len:168 (-) Transcript_66624:232-735(-)